MEANKAISKNHSKWRCREHPNVLCDFICLDGDAKDRVLCLDCIQKQQIPFQNLISMNFVLAANEQDIQEVFPPLKNQKIFSKLRAVSFKQSLEEIEVYFKKLREDFEREVKAAEQRAKEEIIQQEKQYYDLFLRYTRIAEIEKLKVLIVSEKESAEKDLDDFIKEKWRNAEENTKLMSDLINQYEGEQEFTSDEPNRIAEEIKESLKQINFFQQPPQQQQVTFIKSTLGASEQMEIINFYNSIYQVTKTMKQGQYDYVLLDPILDPLKKYILHIEVEQKPENNGNNFIFGLAKDKLKDYILGYSKSMCYSDNPNKPGITKIIKGSPMQSGNKEIGKHSFEVRINLRKNFLRVASLPDYSQVVEMDDSDKIDPKIPYRFFLSMCYIGDMMRITNFITVKKFNKRM